MSFRTTFFGNVKKYTHNDAIMTKKVFSVTGSKKGEQNVKPWVGGGNRELASTAPLPLPTPTFRSRTRQGQPDHTSSVSLAAEGIHAFSAQDRGNRQNHRNLHSGWWWWWWWWCGGGGDGDGVMVVEKYGQRKPSVD